MKLTYLALPLITIAAGATAVAADKPYPNSIETTRSITAQQLKALQLAQAGSDMADGEVKRISKGSKKLTVKHGEIKNLEMPPMTMAFSVSDEKMLDMVKKGDKIKFKAETINGQMVITEIAPQ